MAEPFSFDDTGWPMPRPRQRRRTAQPPAPVTPEEESSLWSNMIGGLAAAGNLIDLPFSMARDVATLNNPFDQLLTPLSSENRMTGRNVLEQYGVVPKNRYQGFDSWKHALDRPSDILGDLAGFAVEMVPLPGVFNPAGWITGPLGTLAKGSSVGARTARTGLKAAKSNPAKVLDKAGELAEATVHYGKQTAKGARPTDFHPTTPAAIADQIRRGERGIFGLANPITGEQMASFGAGSETAANLLDWMFYSESPLTLPVRATRALFSASAGARPGEGMVAKTSARLGDKPGEMTASALSGALQKQKDLKYAYIEQSRAALQDLMPAMTAARGQLNETYAAAAKHLLEAGDEAGAAKLAEMAENNFRQLAETPGFMPEASMSYEQALSAQVRQPIENRLASFMRASLDPGMDPVANKAIDDLVHQAYPLLVSIQKAEDQVALQVESLGGKIDWLNTSYVRHEARRGLYRDPSKPHYSRKEPYRDYPGGTIGVNEWAASPLMSLNKLPKAEQDKAVKEMYGWLHSQGRAWKGMKRSDILEQYAEYALLRPHLDEATDRISRLAAPGTEIPNPEDTLAAWKEVTKRKRTVKGQVKEYETSRLSDMVRYFTNLPATEKQFGKIFANATLEDHLKYMDSMIGKQATLLSAHHLLKEKGVIRKAGEPGTKPLLTAWKEAGYTERGLKTLIDDMAAAGEAVTVQDLSKMAVGDDVARALSTINKFTEPGPTAEYAKWWDRFLSLYRGALTLPFPGFHIRNLAGGVFQEATDNKVPFGTLLKGKIDAFRHLKNGGSLQYLDEAVELGVLDYHTQASMLFGEEAAKQMGGPPTSLTELFIKPFSEARQKGLRKSLDPFAWRGVKTHPEDLARAGKKEDLNLLAEFGESSYKFVEFLNRAGYYEALRRSGYTPAQAVRYVKRAHFDYSSLSSFEKNVARRLGPMFYGWQRKSIPYTMLKIMERPFGKTSQAIRATTIPQRDREEYIPGFMREKMSIPVSSDGPETTYLSQLGLPIEDLNQLSFEGMMPQFKRIGQRQLANLPPPISAPLEMLTGTQFYTGRPIKYLDSPTEDVLGTKMPLVDRALSVGPWSRLVGEGRRLTDQRKWEEPFPWDVLQILANVGTGAKFATYDTEKWKTIDAMNALTEQLEQQPDVAQYEVHYVPEKYRATVDPETQEKIKRARELQELLTRMATLRQAQQRP
jgi:hypothetical protein